MRTVALEIFTLLLDSFFPSMFGTFTAAGGWQSSLHQSCPILLLSVKFFLCMIKCDYIGMIFIMKVVRKSSVSILKSSCAVFLLNLPKYRRLELHLKNSLFSSFFFFFF